MPRICYSGWRWPGGISIRACLQRTSCQSESDERRWHTAEPVNTRCGPGDRRRSKPSFEDQPKCSKSSACMPNGRRRVQTRRQLSGDDRIRSAKRLTSPERWEIKQLIASGAVDASEYPNLDEDFASPVARAEVEEELDVEKMNRLSLLGRHAKP